MLAVDQGNAPSLVITARSFKCYHKSLPGIGADQTVRFAISNLPLIDVMQPVLSRWNSDAF
jgi:hypothetical protein